MTRHPTLHFAALVLLGATIHAQDERGLAIVNARLLPISGPPIERGTLLVRRGKIEKLGADVTAPAGYTVIDAQGGTLMPGAVNAHTNTGLAQAQQPREERPNQFRRGGGRGRRGGTPGPTANSENKSGDKVVDQLYARQDVFAEVLRDGVTTLGIAPIGRGLPGQGAAVRPRGDDVAAMTLLPSAFVSIAPVADTKTKDLIKKALDDGKRTVERRKRRAEAKAEADKAALENKEAGVDSATPEKTAEKTAEKTPEKPAEKPGEKPADGKPSNGKPAEDKPAPKPNEGKSSEGTATARQPQPTPAPDPSAEAIADLLEGKARAMVQVDSAMEFVHWAQASKDTSFPIVLVARRHAMAGAQGCLELVLDKIKQSKATVLLAPEFTTQPNTEYQINLAARLNNAGVEVGFLLGERGRALSNTRTQLMELVRAGLPADVALRGITLTPAKALGVDKLVGSLEVGKAANLLLWSGDPLDPVTRLRHVWLEGTEIEDDAR